MSKDTRKPWPRDPQGKRWDPSITPSSYAAFGHGDAGIEDVATGIPAEGGPRSSTDTRLAFAERAALALREEFGSDVLQLVLFRGEWTAVLKPERILEFMPFLRDRWGFRMCHDVTSVDLYPNEPRFMVVYHLLNLDEAVRLRVKCPVPGDKPEIESVVPIWTGAEYTEREVYDLMGITFLNHPDLRRILMMADYEHHPLRKDFPLTGFPVGIDALKD